MPDNSAAIVIDIGTTNCKVTCFSCLDATTLGAHKFVTAKQISPQGNVDFDIDALWQEVRQAIDLSESTLYPVLRRLQKDGCLEVYDMQFDGRNRRPPLDRVNAALFRLGIKIHHAIHHAVVGDGAGGLPHRLDELGEVADTARAVEQAVFGMDM